MARANRARSRAKKPSKVRGRNEPLVPNAPITNRHVVRIKRANMVKLIDHVPIHAGRGFVASDYSSGYDPIQSAADLTGNFVAAVLSRLVGGRVSIGAVENLARKRVNPDDINMEPDVTNVDKFLRQCRRELRQGVSPLIVLTRAYEAIYKQMRKHYGETDAKENTREQFKEFAKSALPSHIDIDLGRFLPNKVKAIARFFEILQ